MWTLTLATPAPADAQTIYRCGPDGRSFSDRPCGESTAITPKVDRPDPQRADEALAVAQREAQLAERLRSERLARENAPKSGVAGFHPREADGSDEAIKAPKRPKPRSHRVKRERSGHIADGKPADSDDPPATLKSR
jgi:hypothetical protein